MNLDEGTRIWEEMDGAMRSRACAHLSHAVTIIARGAYEPRGAGVACPGRLRTLNEIQHRLSGALMALLKHSDLSGAPAVVPGLFLADRDDAELAAELRHCFDHALNSVAQKTED